MPYTTSPISNGTYTPTITLVGGAGNTTPVYTTNSGRWTQVGNRVFVDVIFTGDGGDEGAGTGRIDVSLPTGLTSSASFGQDKFHVGTMVNGAAGQDVYGDIGASGTTIKLYLHGILTTFTDFTGADQNNTTRGIRLSFNYEI